METGVKEVSSSTKVINNTLESLQKIALMTQEVSSKIQEISAAVLEQSSSSQQVVSTIDDIASVAEQNAVGASQISQVMDQQSASLSSLEEVTVLFDKINKEIQSLLKIQSELQSEKNGNTKKEEKAESEA
ncbi:hypothetical protein A2476_03840 [candidate division CPR3 bacterium RIFOXYC2_FULL_35_7]|nr:MAG: hypothetical protein A2476_03840 [candidate division CPR3 bacterium RIFOXYC2_FULL_35_7]